MMLGLEVRLASVAVVCGFLQNTNGAGVKRLSSMGNGGGGGGGGGGGPAGAGLNEIAAGALDDTLLSRAANLLRIVSCLL